MGKTSEKISQNGENIPIFSGANFRCSRQSESNWIIFAARHGQNESIWSSDWILNDSDWIKNDSETQHWFQQHFLTIGWFACIGWKFISVESLKNMAWARQILLKYQKSQKPRSIIKKCFGGGIAKSKNCDHGK